MIRSRRVCVDVERGRTVSGWRPRRFGGGLGGRHYTKASTRAPGFGPPGGFNGFRGGSFRGGFRSDRGDRNGGFRGGRGGSRGGGFDRGYGGVGYNGGPPDGAPAGPRGNGGFEGGRSGYRGRGGYGGERDDWGPPRYEDGPPRGGGYRDRDSSSSYSSGQKRPYDGGGGYDESRSRRRY
nr:u1 small nuclear ribonucleoprotein 70 kda [Quercus suber]